MLARAFHGDVASGFAVGGASGFVFAGEDDVEFGAELPSGAGFAPHGEVGAGVGEAAVGSCPDPVAVLGGEQGGGGEVDFIGDALVADCFGVGEVLGKGVDQSLAGGDQDAVAADHDVVGVEGGGEGLDVVMLQGFIGGLAGGVDFGFCGVGLGVGGCPGEDEREDGSSCEL